MQRIATFEYAQDIADALEMVPAPIRDRLQHVQFLCDTDPLFSGLVRSWYKEHPYDPGAEVTIACCYPWSTSDGTTTIIVRRPTWPGGIVHEIGHALHAAIGFEHVADPVTDYAGNNRREAFAEAFRAWVQPDGGWAYEFSGYGDPDTAHDDVATRRLFERLADGDFSKWSLK